MGTAFNIVGAPAKLDCNVVRPAAAQLSAQREARFPTYSTDHSLVHRNIEHVCAVKVTCEYSYRISSQTVATGNGSTVLCPGSTTILRSYEGGVRGVGVRGAYFQLLRSNSGCTQISLEHHWPARLCNRKP